MHKIVIIEDTNMTRHAEQLTQLFNEGYRLLSTHVSWVFIDDDARTPAGIVSVLQLYSVDELFSVEA